MKAFVNICVILSCLAIPEWSHAQSGDAGATGLAFLKLGVGGRASAMGEAYVAVSDDASSVFWNPAGLSYIQRPEVAFTHTAWLQDISNDFLAFAFPGFGGGVGVSVYTGAVDGIERRTIPSSEPLGTVEARDLAISLGYARELSSKFRAGFSVKYLYEKIYIEEASGYAFDVGVSYQPFESSLRFAGVIQNIGSMGDLRNDSIKLPTAFRGGGTYSVDLHEFDGVLVLAADAVKFVENDLRGNFGVEVNLLRKLAFRFGYQTGGAETNLGGGFGLRFNRVELDYGYRPFDSDLGDTHRFSFRFEI